MAIKNEKELNTTKLVTARRESQRVRGELRSAVLCQAERGQFKSDLELKLS